MDNKIMICIFCEEEIELTENDKVGEMVECPKCNMMVDIVEF